MALNKAEKKLLELCHTMDVKGTMSGKLKIHQDQKPVDVLGFALQGLGYTFPSRGRDSLILTPDGRKLSPYYAMAKELGFPCCGTSGATCSSKLERIWREIDRKASTNATIRKKIIDECGISAEDAAPYTPWEDNADEEFETL